MSKIKNKVQDWLEDYGYELGYDMSNCPDFVDMDIIQQNNIDAFTYYNNKRAIEQEDLSIKYGAPEDE